MKFKLVLVKENVEFSYIVEGPSTIVRESRDGRTVQTFVVPAVSGNQHFRNRLQSGFEMA